MGAAAPYAAMGLTGAGTMMGMQGSAQEGKDAMKIAKARAAVDVADAQAVYAQMLEKVNLIEEQKVKVNAAVKSRTAAANIKIGSGVDLAAEAENNAATTRNKNFVLQGGTAEYNSLMSQAGMEIAQGKAIRQKSRWDMMTQGLTGFGSMAFMGYQSGMFGTGGGLGGGGSNVTMGRFGGMPGY